LIFISLILSVLCSFNVHDIQNVSHTDETRALILEKARKALIERYNGDRYRFKLKARWIPGSLLKASPENILSVHPEGQIRRASNFQVVYQSQTGRKTELIQLTVQAEKKVPLAKKRIRSGEILLSNNFEMRWLPVVMDRDRLVASVEKLHGKTLRRTLTAGQPVREADISSEYLIEAGESVTLIYAGNGIEIGMKAEARESGSAGDEIKLFSKETRKRYLGKIKNPGTVIWIQTL
jgi:flagella basal body P-ring formation protein FlgA